MVLPLNLKPFKIFAIILGLGEPTTPAAVWEDLAH